MTPTPTPPIGYELVSGDLGLTKEAHWRWFDDYRGWQDPGVGFIAGDKTAPFHWYARPALLGYPVGLPPADYKLDKLDEANGAYVQLRAEHEALKQQVARLLSCIRDGMLGL